MDKNVNLDLTALIYILFGSTLGITLRFFIKTNFKKRIGNNINDIAIVNFLSSFFLGSFLSFNLSNKDLILLLYIGFLGCFSTFSSFIYELFKLLESRKYLRFVLHYIEVLLLSFFFFFLGYYLLLIF